MFKKNVLLLFFIFMSLMVHAQMKFGYLSYDAAFQSMREYAQARKSLDDLKAKYDAEMKRSEDDFNKKYEEFLDGQKDFPQTILQKRQMELQEMMDKNVSFKNEAKRLLRDAENDTFAPLQDRLSAVLKDIGKEKGFAFILNTDYNACPYIDPAQGEDITTLVKDKVK
jgi:outer membrane protein